MTGGCSHQRQMALVQIAHGRDEGCSQLAAQLTAQFVDGVDNLHGGFRDLWGMADKRQARSATLSLAISEGLTNQGCNHKGHNEDNGHGFEKGFRRLLRFFVVIVHEWGPLR